MNSGSQNEQKFFSERMLANASFKKYLVYIYLEVIKLFIALQ